ncbi:MAG TPA: cyclic nucleotide-binding domain-containing protein, partial [Ilumatobacteraceae bacterium]
MQNDNVDVAARLADELGPRSRALTLHDGEILVHEGDEAEEVFLLADGDLLATTATPFGSVTVGRLHAGEVIGEVTVIAGGRRTATLVADGPAEVLAIGREDFEQWLSEHGALADAMAEQARERIDRTQVAAMVTDLMGASTSDLVQEIVDRVEWRRLEAGAVLFHEDDPSDAAYFIVGGRLVVTVRTADGGEEILRELGRGEVVGELGLLDGAPRSATVRAVRDTTLASFSTKTFEELVSRHPSLMLHVARGILTRLKRSPRRLIDRAAALSVAVTAPVDSKPIIDGLVGVLSKHGSVRHLSSDRVDRLLNRDGIAQAAVDNVGVPRLSEFIHEADVGNDHLVLETDREMSAWTRRALRHADRVVIVVSSRPDRAERQHIRALLEVIEGMSHVVRVLAVLHPPGTDRPRGTATLMRELGFDEVVHLRDGRADDIGRLARLATGHGVGLVLSGGGARGFAHIGVFRALCELGVPVDHVAGCSIGSVIAGGIALDLPLEDAEHFVEEQFKRLLDYTVPVVSLVKGQRITRNLDANFGAYDIEDLWRPFYCVSTNLTTSELHVHRRGNAARAIRASVAIPGVLPPVPHDGDLLVDGGVLNNLPVEVMRHDGGIGTVIAVDVAPPRGPRAKTDYGLHVSGFRALGPTVRRTGAYPSVAAILLRSMLTGAVRNQQEAVRDGSVDLMLQLHLPGVGLLDFASVHTVAKAGYDSSIDQIG